MEIVLNKWQLKGCWENEPILYGYENYGRVRGVTLWMDAVVPGSVYMDLQKNGYIKDPYYDDNSLLCEWVENRWWIYKTEFTLSSEIQGKNVELVFRGLDYKSHFVLNGMFIGQHEGMYMDCRVDISHVIEYGAVNTLYVVLEGIPREMCMFGYTSKTHTQKSRFGYKWDFSTRLVNIGIYDQVLLCVNEGCRFEDVKITPVCSDGQWFVDIDINLCYKSRERYLKADFYIDFDGKAGMEEIEVSSVNTYYNKRIPVEDPILWWPSGHGEQHLYPLTIEMRINGGISDRKTYRVGLRTLAYRHTKGANPKIHFPYNVVINGKPIYLKGVNFVPLDHMYGCVTAEKYREVLQKAKDGNINTIRVWGGGLIESEIFYDLCDELGIMVWQDFIQSSASIEDVPAKDEDFLELLRRVSTFAVKLKRNHVSLTYWCGGNELTDEKYINVPVREERNNHPATFEDRNLAMLRDIVAEYDGMRLMLPTSASGDTEWLVLNSKGVNQDIHGPWKYQGVEDHYKLFNQSDSMLHSEFGCDGMSDLETLKRFLSDEHIGLFSRENNQIWEHHTTGWETYESREYPIFGEFSQQEFPLFITCSQYMQGEGIRYAVEANRRRVWENCGSIVWQFNEPWPNICCTNLVDYYGNEKLAYYFLASGYRVQMPSLKYNKLLYAPGETFDCETFIHNELEQTPYKLDIEIINADGVRFFLEHIQGYIGRNTVRKAGSISIEIPSHYRKGIKVILTATFSNTTEKSEYLIFIADPDTGKADKYFVGEYAGELGKSFSK